MLSIMRQINIISRCGGIYRSDKLCESELGTCHHSYVRVICKHPGITQDELSKRIFINKSNVTRSLKYLEDHEFIMRIQSENDRRNIKVYPAPKMLEILPEVLRVSKEWNEYITKDLNSEELELFGKMLERVSSCAKEYVESRVEDKA